MTNEILIPKNKTQRDEVFITAPLFLLSNLTILTSLVLIQEGGNSLLLTIVLIVSILVTISAGCMIANVFEFVTEEKIQHRKKGIAFIQKTVLDNTGIVIPVGYAKALYYRRNSPINFIDTDNSTVTISMVKNGENYNLDVSRTPAPVTVKTFTINA
jgi:hypothetical protein